MKTIISMLCCAGIALTTVPGAAQNNTTPEAGARTHQLYRGSKIIGSAVRDPKDKKIGEIKDIVLDSKRGEIAYAIINFGGVMGIGAKYHAVPWQALEAGDDGRYYILYADQETISQAPGFDRSRWPDMANHKWSDDVDRYWSRMVGRTPPTGENRLSTDATGTGGSHDPGTMSEQSSGK